MKVDVIQQVLLMSVSNLCQADCLHILCYHQNKTTPTEAELKNPLWSEIAMPQQSFFGLK